METSGCKQSRVHRVVDHTLCKGDGEVTREGAKRTEHWKITVCVYVCVPVCVCVKEGGREPLLIH